MLPDRVSNPGPLTYESGALPIALRGPATADTSVGFEVRIKSSMLSCLVGSVTKLVPLLSTPCAVAIRGENQSILSPSV